MMNKKAQFFPLGDDNKSSTLPFITWALIGINILVFLWSLSDFDNIINTLGFTPLQFSFFTMFTSMFLHGSIQHILGNMWFLFIFGDNVEDRLGHWAYLVFYLAAGVAASISHFILNMSSSVPAVGASGAISGVLGAYLVFFPNADVYVSGNYGHAGKVKAIFMLGLWFIFQLISGSMALFGAESGIAFFAHVGGFVFGVVTAFIIKKAKPA